MSSFTRPLCLAFVLALALSPDVRADEQAIPPGIPKEGELAADTGPDGLCNSTAAGDDVQLAPVGGGTPNLAEIGCGPDGVVGSSAVGDDVQLRPLGSFCGTANVPVIDTGADGVANSLPGGDDIFLPGMVSGTAPANTACVGTGPNGLSGTAVAGDDVQILAVGLGAAGAAVVHCGDDLIPETTANNANPGGDDVQVIPVAFVPTCASANDVVVSSGPTNSISDTRSEGPELVIRAGKPVKVVIPSGRSAGTKSLKLQVYNFEFGATPARSFEIRADDANCPDGTLTLVDADYETPGLQTTGSVDNGRSVKVSMEAVFLPDRVRTVSTKIPFRCEADITVVATDTLPEEDDARVRRNNSTRITFEVYDYNDLP
jgi:hypothetical protein